MFRKTLMVFVIGGSVGLVFSGRKAQADSKAKTTSTAEAASFDDKVQMDCIEKSHNAGFEVVQELYWPKGSGDLKALRKFGEEARVILEKKQLNSEIERLCSRLQTLGKKLSKSESK